jgi:hypothetical protein
MEEGFKTVQAAIVIVSKNPYVRSSQLPIPKEYKIPSTTFKNLVHKNSKVRKINCKVNQQR